MLRVFAGAAAALLLAMGPHLLPSATQPIPSARSFKPIETSSGLCPNPSAGSDSQSVVAAGVIEGLPTGSSSGVAAISPLGGGSAGVSIAKVGEQAQLIARGVSLPPVEGAARGVLAPGFHVGQLTRDVAGESRGLSSLTCREALPEQWFVGASSAKGRRARLDLVNPTASPIQVDVAIYGIKGKLDSPSTRGIVIAPGERHSVRIDAVTPDQPVTAVHVTTTVGRASAALIDEQFDGLRPAGIDWLPVTAAPATQQVIPGIPGGAGERQLSILVPGDEGAGIKVRALTREGSAIPVGLEKLDAPAGKVITLDIAKALGGGAAALELVGDKPFVAGFRAVIEGPEKSTEVLFGAAAPGVRRAGGNALATALPVSVGLSVAVMVAAPEREVRGTITLIPYGTTADSIFGPAGPTPPAPSESATPTPIVVPSVDVTLPPLPTLAPLPGNPGPLPEVGVPAADPSGSPSEVPSVTASPSASPSASPNASDSGSPAASATVSPAASSTGEASAGTSAGASAGPSAGPSVGPSAGPSGLPSPSSPFAPDVTEQGGKRSFPVVVEGGSSEFIALPAPPDAAWFTAIWTSDDGSGAAYLAHVAIESGTDSVAATGFPWLPLRSSVLTTETRYQLGVTRVDGP